MKIQFTQNIEKDVNNWQNSVKANSYGVDWKKNIPEDITLEEIQNKKRLKVYLKNKFYKSNVNLFKRWLESKVNSSQIQKDLELLMGRKFPFKNVKAIITTYRRAPYNTDEKFFYIIYREGKFRKAAITVIYHELMHFLFHIYFWSDCKKVGLNDSQIHKLKESMTVLLNPILKKRKLSLDTGYLDHKKLRLMIEKYWKGDDFESFLKKNLLKFRRLL